MIRTFATASCSWSDPPGSRHVLASQPHRKRGGRLEMHSNAWRSHAARSYVAAKRLAVSRKNRPHIDRNLFAIHPVTNSEISISKPGRCTVTRCFVSFAEFDGA